MGADLRHGFTSHLIRCQDFNGAPCFFVGSELSFETKLNAVIDAIYVLQLEDNERTSFEFGLMYGGHSEQELLMQILANLNQLIHEKVNSTYLWTLNGLPFPLHPILTNSHKVSNQSWLSLIKIDLNQLLSMNLLRLSTTPH